MDLFFGELALKWTGFCAVFGDVSLVIWVLFMVCLVFGGVWQVWLVF